MEAKPNDDNLYSLVRLLKQDNQGQSLKRRVSQIYEDHYNMPERILIKNKSNPSILQIMQYEEEKVPEVRQSVVIDDEEPLACIY